MLGLAVVSLVTALLPGGSTFSAFSATTANTASTGTAGTVALTDNDAGTAMSALSNTKPGDTDTSCIQVTSTGTLASLVRLYGTTTGTGLDAYVTLTVTRGTGASSFDDCTGFTADATNYTGNGAGVLYSGTLAAYPDDYAGGISDPRTASVAEAWTTGETHSYKLTLTVDDVNAAQNLNVTQAFTWEARNTTLYSQVVLSDQPASYWKLDEAAGTSAADPAGGATGTYTNGPVLNQTSGVRDAGTAVAFDGVDDSVAMGDVHDFAGTAAFSVETWLQRTTVNEATLYRRLVDKESFSPAHDGWGINVQPDSSSLPQRLQFERWSAGTQNNTDGATPIVAGRWYHVTVTYDGTTAKIYVNGALDGSRATSLSLPGNAAGLRIASTPANNGRFGGVLDEVAVYGYALTAQQVTDHYNAGRR